MNFKEFKIHQALVTLDLSDLDDKVLDYINFLNKEIKIGSLYFLHVIKKAGFFSNLFFKDSSSLQSQFILDEDIIKHFISGVESKLTKAEYIHVEYAVKEGQPLNVIIDEINENHADLVIVGKKPLGESSGVLGKSIARRSPCSVLFVPKDAVQQLKTIVVPVDFSENSGRALQTAFAINNIREKPAKIVCLHIYEMPDLSIYRINKTYEQLKSIIEADLLDAFDNFLDTYVPDLKDIIEKNLTERTHISTAGHLNESVKELEADLVIIGAKGHTPIERLLLGSVTEKFLQMNEIIPTLIVR